MHEFSPLYSPFGPTLLAALLPLIILVAVWTVAIKGYSLWHAARGGQKEWFIALLVLNTLGILEIIYLVWFRKTSSHSSTPAVSSSSQA